MWRPELRPPDQGQQTNREVEREAIRAENFWCSHSNTQLTLVSPPPPPNADVGHQPLPEVVPEEQDVHANHDDYHREHVKHGGGLPPMILSYCGLGDGSEQGVHSSAIRETHDPRLFSRERSALPPAVRRYHDRLPLGVHWRCLTWRSSSGPTTPG